MDYKKSNEKRRAVNFFDPAATITVEEIRAVYEQARLAPSSFNLQPLKIVVAHSAEAKEKLRAAAMGQPKVTEASAVLVLFGNLKQAHEGLDIFEDRVAKGYMKQEDIPRYVALAQSLYPDEKREIAFVSRNVGLFAMNFMLAAQDAGWDTHPMDGFDIDAVREAFGMEPKYLPVMLVAIGRRSPDTSLLPRPARREFRDAVIVE